MSEWRSFKTDPPKEGAIIAAKDGVGAILGRVIISKSGGMFRGLTCIDGVWLDTGNIAKRPLADFSTWKPAREVVNLNG